MISNKINIKTKKDIKMKKIRTIVMQHMIGVNLLTILVLCVVLMSFVMASFFSDINAEQIDTLEQISQRALVIQNASIVTAQQIEDVFGQRLLNLSYSEDDLIINELDSMYQTIDDFYGEIGVPLSVLILMKDGFEYFSENETDRDTHAIKTNYWYINNFISDNNDVWVHRFEDEKAETGNVLSYGEILRDAEGNYQGIILVSSTEEHFYDLYANLITQNSVVYILDENGNAISHTNKNLINVQLMHMKSFFDRYERNNVTIEMKKNTPTLVATYYNEQSKWTIVRETSIFAVFNEYASVFIVFTAIVLIAILILVLISSWSISKRISNPLEEFRNKLLLASNASFHKMESMGTCREVYEVTLIYNDMVTKIEELIECTKNNERAKRAQELKFLQLQMKPHFLHNTLFSIRCLIELGDTKKAVHMMDNFMKVLKVPIQAKSDSIKLIDELEIAKAYFELMKIKYGCDIELYYDCEDTVKTFLVPRLILQPIIENAILHGVDDKNEESRMAIEIYAYTQEDFVVVKVSDNGVGMTQNELDQIWCETQHKSTNNNSIGLKNIRERVKLAYGEQSNVIVKSQKWEGTEITIKMLENNNYGVQINE